MKKKPIGGRSAVRPRGPQGRAAAMLSEAVDQARMAADLLAAWYPEAADDVRRAAHVLADVATVARYAARGDVTP